MSALRRIVDAIELGDGHAFILALHGEGQGQSAGAATAIFTMLSELGVRAELRAATVETNLIELARSGGDGGQAPVLIVYDLDRLGYGAQSAEAALAARRVFYRRTCLQRDHIAQQGRSVVLVEARAHFRALVADVPDLIRWVDGPILLDLRMPEVADDSGSRRPVPRGPFDRLPAHPAESSPSPQVFDHNDSAVESSASVNSRVTGWSLPGGSMGWGGPDLSSWTGSRWDLVQRLVTDGRASLARGAIEDAEHALREALDHDDRALHALVELASANGADPDRASEAMLRRVFDEITPRSDPITWAVAMMCWARMLEARGEPARAAQIRAETEGRLASRQAPRSREGEEPDSRLPWPPEGGAPTAGGGVTAAFESSATGELDHMLRLGRAAQLVGLTGVARSHIEAGIARLDRSAPSAVGARLYLELGRLRMMSGERGEGELDVALSHFQALGDARGEAEAWAALGRAAHRRPPQGTRRDDLELAEARLARAADAFRRQGERLLFARCCIDRARVAIDAGRASLAVRFAGDALRMAEAHGDRDFCAVAAQTLVEPLLVLGEVDASASALKWAASVMTLPMLVPAVARSSLAELRVDSPDALAALRRTLGAAIERVATPV